MKVLVNKFGDKMIVKGGFLFMAIGYGCLSAVHTIAPLVLFLTFNNFGSAVLRPAVTSQISQNVGREHQGAALGVNQSLQSTRANFSPSFEWNFDRPWMAFSVGFSLFGSSGFGVLSCLGLSRLL